MRAPHLKRFFIDNRLKVSARDRDGRITQTHYRGTHESHLKAGFVFPIAHKQIPHAE
jgi:hypothetical protein